MANCKSVEDMVGSKLGSGISVLDFDTGRLEDEYEVNEFLGKGTCGLTRKCRELSTGNYFACKTIPKSFMDGPEIIECFKREVQIMTRLSECGWIVKFKDVFEDESDLHIVMELCDGGTLYDFIENRGYFFSEQEAAFTANVMSQMVEELHSMGVMHRDLKPDNFLLANLNDLSSLRGSDFSHSVFFIPGEKHRGGGGAFAYRAPEVFVGDYGPEVDVWSLGVNLAYLLSGQLPPHPGNKMDFHTSPWVSVSDCAKDLINRMMETDPSKRIKLNQVRYHPWVINQGFPFGCICDYFEKLAKLLQDEEIQRIKENSEIRMQLVKERKKSVMLENELEKVKKENEELEEDSDTMVNSLNSALNRQDKMLEELIMLQKNVEKLMKEKCEKEEELNMMHFSLQKALNLRDMEKEVREKKEEELKNMQLFLEIEMEERAKENASFKMMMEITENEKLNWLLKMEELRVEKETIQQLFKQMETNREEEKKMFLQAAEEIKNETVKLEKYWKEMEEKRIKERDVEREYIMEFTETQFLQNKKLESELEKQKREKELISARLQEWIHKIELEKWLNKQEEEETKKKEKKRKENDVWENFFFDFEVKSNSNMNSRHVV